MAAWFDVHPRMFCLFLSPYSPLLKPHWVLVCVETEGLWPPATCPGWPSRRPGDHTWALSRMDQTCEEILPQVPWQGRHLLWCWGGHVAQCRRLGNRSIFLFFFIPCIHTLVNGNVFFFSFLQACSISYTYKAFAKIPLQLWLSFSINSFPLNVCYKEGVGGWMIWCIVLVYSCIWKTSVGVLFTMWDLSLKLAGLSVVCCVLVC